MNVKAEIDALAVGLIHNSAGATRVTLGTTKTTAAGRVVETCQAASPAVVVVNRGISTNEVAFDTRAEAEAFAAAGVGAATVAAVAAVVVVMTDVDTGTIAAAQTAAAR